MGRKLFVGNLAFETTDDDLKQAFSKAGVCESASVIKERPGDRSRGFGFVEMSSDEEAQRAIAELNGRELHGRMMRVSEARERSESRGPRPPGEAREFGPDRPPSGPRFRKNGGSRRGVRARRRSL
ncbi:MAG TPA: RNA-binding protein [Candidatus Polarisedimenticolia bacterium]|nr:RNA-binding protein [Candidatus Polarisedimenticolia bacterium]